jgi:16S rRNA (adenine1518-N6/adenine1519-N6)-dimethyltransferase
MSRMRELLDRHGLRPKKAWGQNFLADERAVERIVDAAGATSEDVVVEIGAGLGALTAPLAARARRVIAVDRDPDMIAVLRAELEGVANVEIRSEDAQSFDFVAAARTAGRPLIVVGNLPYQITSTLLFAILEASGAGSIVRRAVVMIQKEVADRVRAAPGSKTYGRLSVMVQQLADVRALFEVPPGAFIPNPQVRSTVLALEPRPAPRAAVADAALFAEVVRRAFGARRKMLRRALAGGWEDDGVAAALQAAGIEGTRRAEELSIEELARVSDAIGRAARRRVDPEAVIGGGDDA